MSITVQVNSTDVNISTSSDDVINITVATASSTPGQLGYEKYYRVILTGTTITTGAYKIGLGTITPSWDAGTETLTLSSDTAGDFDDETFIEPNQRDCDFSLVDDQTIEIYPNTDYGTLVVRIFKEN